MNKFLQEGDLFLVREGMVINTEVPLHFLYSDSKGVFNETGRGNVVVEGELDYLAGEYVVYKTAFNGGGTGHGPYDIYPDGYHVYAEKIDTRETKIDFYQTGCFINLQEDIPVTGKAIRQWVKEEEG